MSPSTTPPVGPTLTFRGIDYDTGTSTVPGWHSRPDWSGDVVRADLATIRDDLHRNAVSVFGSDVGRLAVAAPPSTRGVSRPRRPSWPGPRW